MIISSDFVQFCKLALSLLRYTKLKSVILDSFQFEKFWSHISKVMAKDKKVNIAVT